MDLTKLKQNFKGEIETAEATLEKYSRDASIFKIAPQVVVKPKDVTDVQTLVRFATEQKNTDPNISLTVRAGGTDMTGGSINDSIIIDVAAHLNRIIEVNEHFAIVEPGVMFRDFEIATLARGLIMPAFPVSKAICAVGGMVGNNAGGEKTYSYGQVTNFVEELDVILADGNVYTIGPLSEQQLQAKMAQQNYEGELYKKLYSLINDNYRMIQNAKPTTSKNSAGYFLWDVWDGKTFNLAKLFVGSQGTLGIITKIKFRLVKPKRQSQLAVFFLNDVKELGHVIGSIKPLNPESFEIFDEHTMRTAIQYLPEILRKMKGSRLKLALKFLPEIWMTIRGGIPKIILLAEFTGDRKEDVEQQAYVALKTITGKYGIPGHLARNHDEAQKYWTIRRESYNLLRQHNARKVSAPFIEDIVVHPDQLPEFMPQLDAVFSKYPSFIYTIAGHAGDANFHIMPLMDLSDKDQRDVIYKLSDDVFNLVMRFQGSITAEHNDGLVRGPFLKKMFGEQVFNLFRQTKVLFDPHNIFNPHKKTEAELPFYTEHIKHGI